MVIKHVIGIDVSKDTLTYALGSVTERQEQNIGSAMTVDNNIKGFRQMLSFVRKNRKQSDAPVYFVMEATGIYYENLAYFLSDNNHQVVVALPNKTKNFFRTLEIKSKTDQLDAKMLTQYGLEKQLQLWQIPSPSMKALKALTREHSSIKRMMVQLKNQIHAKNYAYKPLKESQKRSYAALTIFQKQIKEIEIQIRKLVDSDSELNDRIKKIEKIKGIGFMSIVSIIAETNGFALIHNEKQLASYAGLDVVYNESGLKKHRTTISKKGNKHLRQAVYMPAVSASRWNPKMKKLYARLVRKKGIKMVALIAIARKLLLLVYTIYNKNVEYISDYNPAANKHTMCFN